MSLTKRDRYTPKQRSPANKFTEQVAIAVSDSNTDNARRSPDYILESDTSNQASSQVSRGNNGETEDRAVPAIPIDALLALIQTITTANAEPKTDIRLPSYDGDGDLSLSLRQLNDIAETWAAVVGNDGRHEPAKPQQVCFKCGGLYLQRDCQKEGKQQLQPNFDRKCSPVARSQNSERASYGPR